MTPLNYVLGEGKTHPVDCHCPILPKEDQLAVNQLTECYHRPSLSSGLDQNKLSMPLTHLKLSEQHQKGIISRQIRVTVVCLFKVSLIKLLAVLSHTEITMFLCHISAFFQLSFLLTYTCTPTLEVTYLHICFPPIPGWCIN